jgi:NADH dehydrogenase
MILVTGGTGFVGSHVLRRLNETEPRGTVRTLVRNRAKAVVPDGVSIVEGDVTQPESLRAAVTAVDVIIHAAAITGDRKEPYRGAYDRVNRVGTENLMSAAKNAGVKRLVVVSGLGCRSAPAGTYMATRWGMEEAVRGSGIPFVILQPSVLFGAGAPFVAALAGLARVLPVLPLVGGGRTRFQPLWIEDLVTSLVASTSSETLTGRALPLGGSEWATFKEVLQTICKAMSARRLLVPLPMPIARIQASLMTAVLPNPPLTPAALELFSFDNATDLDAVDKAFGFHPRGFREHLLAHGTNA